MAIRSEMKHRYPGNWKEISKAAREKAANKCEECGVVHMSRGWRDEDGVFHVVTEPAPASVAIQLVACPGKKIYRIIRIILTVHHINELPEDCRPENLIALCQKCHLAKHRNKGNQPLEGTSATQD